MKFSKTIFAALLTATASFSAFAASSLSYQGVTFSEYAVDSDTLSFTITGADMASGDWSGVHYIKAFSFKDIGNFTSATVVSGPSFASVTESTRELSANGCATGNSHGACFSFTQPAVLTHSMTWTIDFVTVAGNALDFSSPHLKVDFYKNLSDRKSTGSLLSAALVTSVPEPETYALLLAGLGLVGAVVRRRRSAA